MVPINYLAVLVAAVISVVLGTLWYGPIFGKPWMALMGYTKESTESAKQKGMGKSYALMMVGSLISAYVLAHVVVYASVYMNVSGWGAGMSAGVWMWLGFIVPVTLGSVLWESKPWKLWFINTGYYLVLFIIQGGLLSVWR